VSNVEKFSRRNLVYYILLVNEIFFERVEGVGSLFLLPFLFWTAYLLWSHYMDYPADLEKHIRKGKVWPYLPIYWKGKRRKLILMASISLFWAGNLFSACSLYYIFPYQHWIFMLIGMGLSILVQTKARSLITDKIIRLQHARYLQIYTHLKTQAVDKGDEISDSELEAKAQWQQQNELRLADKQGRLLLFLRGEAKL
jgi:hypothetical protein